MKWFSISVFATLVLSWAISLRYSCAVSFDEYALILQYGQICGFDLYDPNDTCHGLDRWINRITPRGGFNRFNYGFTWFSGRDPWIGGDYKFRAPLWVPLTAVTIWVVWAWRRASIPAHVCRKCGYDLTGNVSGVCPECGAVVRGVALEREAVG